MAHSLRCNDATSTVHGSVGEQNNPVSHVTCDEEKTKHPPSTRRDHEATQRPHAKTRVHGVSGREYIDRCDGALLSNRCRANGSTRPERGSIPRSRSVPFRRRAPDACVHAISWLSAALARNVARNRSVGERSSGAPGVSSHPSRRSWARRGVVAWGVCGGFFFPASVRCSWVLRCARLGVGPACSSSRPWPVGTGRVAWMTGAGTEAP